MRLTVITRKGLADLIREKFGVKAAIFMLRRLLIANLGTLITELVRCQNHQRHAAHPSHPICHGHRTGVIFFLSSKGNYKLTQAIMLIASLFYIVYIISAVKANPDWGLAVQQPDLSTWG